MKKKLFLSMLLVALMSLGLVLGVSAAETTDLLTPDYLSMPSGGTWEWVDGALVATNRDLGDTGIMTEVFVEPGDHVVIEATATITDGNAWGIMLAEVDPSAPFASWVCLNMDLTRPSTRLFGPGVGTPNEAELRNPDFMTGQPYTLALEITDEGEFIVYFNGESYGSRLNEGFIGAYVGLMSFFSNTTYTDCSITYLEPGETYTPEKIEMVVVEKPVIVRSMNLGEATDLLKEENFKVVANGEFNWVDGKLVAPNAALGDCATMTDYFVDVDDHVYIEVTGNVTEGQAFGIHMPRLNYETPFDSWMCMNMEIGRPSTRLFGPGFAKEVQLYGDFANNQPLTIGVEIDKGTFYLYSEGECFGYIENTDWVGCYLGLMTWTGSCEFTSYKVYDVLGTESYTKNPDGTIVDKKIEGEFTATEAPVEEAPVVEEPVVETPVVEAPVEEAPVVEAPVEEVVETPAATEEVAAPVVTAPQTFDAVIFAGVAAMVSLAGYALTKKRG